MKAIDEGESPLLGNSLVFFSSEIEDGNSQSHSKLPIVLAGSCQGVFETGRHVRYSDDEPVADLFTSILNGLDVENDSFGEDGTGPLAGLTL